MTATPYLLTASGQRYRLTGPELDAPRIGDIAHHLAQINRFTGAASRPYSVAEHSLLCEHIAASEGAGPMARLCALMHDAHEAYTADASSPAKVALRRLSGWDGLGSCTKNSDYDKFEHTHSLNVTTAFNLREGFIAFDDDIRRWDLIALATERRELMPIDDGEGWEILRGVEPLTKRAMPFGFHDYRDWFYWRELFLYRFNELAGVEL